MHAESRPPRRPRAIDSIAVVFTGNIATRIVGLLGQIIVGWLLLPEDFGIYALALSFSTAVGALRGGGATQIMINREQSFFPDARLFFTYSLFFNLLAMLLLAALAIPYLVRESAVGVVLLGTALSIPIGTHASISRAKLSIERRFREISVVNIGSALVWQASVVAFAFLGWGAASFAIPPILQSAFESAALHAYSGPSSSPRRIANFRAEFFALFREGHWMMLGAALLALATTGQYFAVSLFADAATVGTFFFAFQLIVSLAMPIYGAVETVTPVLFAQLNGDPVRQRDAYAKTLRWICVVAIPASFLVAFLAPVLIHVVWQGKWDGAAPLTQIFCACVPAWLLITAGRSLLEAKGLWRLRFVVVALYGCGGIAAAAIGAFNGGLVAIAGAITCFYVAFAAFLLFALSRLDTSAQRTGESLWLPLVVNLPAAALCVSISSVWFASAESWVRACVNVLAFVLIGAVLNYRFLRATWLEITDALLIRFAARWSRSALSESV